jgi:hypothetical protein
MQVTKLIHAGLDRLGLAHPSQDYRLKKRVRLIDLIDGRLEKFAADLAREAEKFGVELQGFISTEPVR